MYRTAAPFQVVLLLICALSVFPSARTAPSTSHDTIKGERNLKKGQYLKGKGREVKAIARKFLTLARKVEAKSGSKEPPMPKRPDLKQYGNYLKKKGLEKIEKGRDMKKQGKADIAKGAALKKRGDDPTGNECVLYFAVAFSETCMISPCFSFYFIALHPPNLSQ